MILMPGTVKTPPRYEDIKINIKQQYEVQYWSRKWGISALQLESAVKAAGTNVAREVEAFLRRSGKLTD
jgi:hypothetical protein